MKDNTLLLALALIISLIINSAVGVANSNRLRLASPLGQYLSHATENFFRQCVGNLCKQVDKLVMEKLLHELVLRNPNLINGYHQQLVAARSNDSLSTRETTRFVKNVSRKLYPPLQKIDRSFAELYDQRSFTERIEYIRQTAMERTRIASFAQGQSIGDILATVSDVLQREKRNHRSLAQIDTFALREISGIFQHNQALNQHLPASDAAKILEIAKENASEPNLIALIFSEIAKREMKIVELGIVIGDILEAHHAGRDSLQGAVATIFADDDEGVVVIGDFEKQADNDFRPLLIEKFTNEHSQNLLGRKLVLISRADDRLSVGRMQITDSGEVTIHSSTKVDGNTLFVDKEIVVSDLVEREGDDLLPLNLLVTENLPLSITWQEVLADRPSSHYLLAKFQLDMGWQHADLEAMPADSYLKELLEKEKNYLSDRPDKLALVENFIADYHREISRELLVSQIISSTHQEGQEFSRISSPYLQDFSPADIFDDALTRLVSYRSIHKSDGLDLREFYRNDSEKLYQTGNLNAVIKLLQKKGLANRLTTTSIYTKLRHGEDLNYRESLRLQILLEELFRELVPTTEEVSIITTLPMILKFERFAQRLVNNTDIIESLTELRNQELFAPLSELLLTKITDDELTVDDLQSEMENLLKMRDHALTSSPPATTNYQPEVTEYSQPHWRRSTPQLSSETLPTKPIVEPPTDPTVVALQSLPSSLTIRERIAELNKIFAIVDETSLYKKINKRKHRRPTTKKLGIDSFLEIINQEKINQRELKITKQHLDAIAEVYRRQISGTARHRIQQLLNEQLVSIQQQLRKKANG